MAYKIRPGGLFDRAPPRGASYDIPKDPQDIGKGRIFRQSLSFLRGKHGCPQSAKGP